MCGKCICKGYVKVTDIIDIIKGMEKEDIDNEYGGDCITPNCIGDPTFYAVEPEMMACYLNKTLQSVINMGK